MAEITRSISSPIPITVVLTANTVKTVTVPAAAHTNWNYIRVLTSTSDVFAITWDGTTPAVPTTVDGNTGAGFYCVGAAGLASLGTYLIPVKASERTTSVKVISPAATGTIIVLEFGVMNPMPISE